MTEKLAMQQELFSVEEVGERRELPAAARAGSRARATPAPIGAANTTDASATTIRRF